VGAGYTELARNAGSGGFDSVAIDTLNPTMSISFDDALPTFAAPASTVSFSFNETVLGFEAADTSVSGGSLTGLAVQNTTSYTATFTADSDTETTGMDSVGTEYLDVVGNTGTAGSNSVAIDTLVLTVTVDIADTLLTDANNVSVVPFEFSEAVFGFDAADVSVGGGVLADFMAVDADSYTATFTANDGTRATGSVSVGTGYLDAVGNSGTAGTDTVAIDTLNPTVTVDIVDGALYDGDRSSVVTFQFSEAVTGFSQSDVSVSGGTLSNFSMAAADRYAAVLQVADNVELTDAVSVTGTYTDLGGNAGTPASSSGIVDTLAPTVAVNIVESVLSDVNTSLVTFLFSEPVAGFAPGDVSITNGVGGSFFSVDSDTFTNEVTPSGNGALIGGDGDDDIRGSDGVDTLVAGTGNNDPSPGDVITDTTTVIDEVFVLDPPGSARYERQAAPETVARIL
jgi:hypothetical protein